MEKPSHETAASLSWVITNIYASFDVVTCSFNCGCFKDSTVRLKTYRNDVTVRNRRNLTEHSGNLPESFQNSNRASDIGCLDSLYWVKIYNYCNLLSNRQWPFFFLLSLIVRDVSSLNTLCGDNTGFLPLLNLNQQLPLLLHPWPHTDVTRTQHSGHNTHSCKAFITSGPTMRLRPVMKVWIYAQQNVDRLEHC